jgi:predicted Zn-dependent protease
MILCPKLLLNRIVTIFVLTALVLLPYLSHSYFPNHYAIGARSSLHKITVGEGTIQICCSWGDQITDGILTYKIIDSSNSQVVNVVHQAIDEWNSKVSNIKLQESTSENTSADIDIKLSSKAPQVIPVAGTIGGHAILAGKNTKLVQPGETVISVDSNRLIAHVDITISTIALGNSISSYELESIAKHEIGHAYGIGHTDFVGDLMSPILTSRTDTSISACDINAVIQANIWKTAQRTGYHSDKNVDPSQPSVDFIKCK